MNLQETLTLKIHNEQGTTVIVVTHNMEIVKAMNKRVITMKKGVKVEDSKGEEQTDEY